MVADKKLVIGHKVRAIREMQGVSQEFLAEKLKLSQTSLSKIENGEMKIDFERLCEIAEILDVDINTIINFDKSVVFNSCNQSGYINNNNIHPLEHIASIYEKLISEKDDRIKFLEGLVKKE